MNKSSKQTLRDVARPRRGRHRGLVDARVAGDRLVGHGRGDRGAGVVRSVAAVAHVVAVVTLTL